MSSSELAAWILAALSAIIALVFLFVVPMLRKNFMRQQEEKRKKFISNIKKKDKVILIGGIHGIIKAKDKTIATVEIADTIEVKVELDSIIGYSKIK